MKKLIFIVVFISIAICTNAQEIYLSGRITGFDINTTGIDRPVDFLKMKGNILLDKESLVIHTRRKGKDWVLDYQVQSINDLGKQDGYSLLEFSFNDIEDKITEASLKIYDDGTWILNYKDNRGKMYYTGITMKQYLFDLRLK